MLSRKAICAGCKALDVAQGHRALLGGGQFAQLFQYHPQGVHSLGQFVRARKCLSRGMLVFTR